MPVGLRLSSIESPWLPLSESNLCLSLTHGHVVRCANLFKGETYKHTYDQHLESLRLGAKIFCNDVICKY